MPGTVLIIEDEATLAKNMSAYLARYGFDPVTATTAEDGLAEAERLRPDIVLLDFHLPGMDGMRALAALRTAAPGLPVIMITGHGTVELAVEAMKAGAYDFLTKPVSLAKLRLLLERALGEGRREQALSYYQRRDAREGGLDSLIGDSPAMRQLRARITQLVEAERGLRDADAPAVLITGETGTGKELAARALHFGGARAAQPFVEINCAAIPAQLLESELFGHERGAFTDARERKIGLVETASGGTLFLDEIGDLDLDLGLQAKLLKLLEEKTVRRIGNVREQKVDVRIVAATHQPLDQRVREGRFRADLYYRLRIVELQMPALRERGDDVLLLARHFLALHAARYGRQPLQLGAEARARLLRHAWPGNVRELRNLMEQAVLLCPGPELAPELLPLAPARAVAEVPRAEAGATLEDMERTMLVDALRQTGWNVTQAARLLGISRDTLRYRIDKHRLEPG